MYNYVQLMLHCRQGELAVTITGIWALVRYYDTYQYTVTTGPVHNVHSHHSISVIIISALVIIVGMLMIAAVVGCVLFVKYERPSISNEYRDYFSFLNMVQICMLSWCACMVSLSC